MIETFGNVAWGRGAGVVNREKLQFVAAVSVSTSKRTLTRGTYKRADGDRHDPQCRKK